MCVWVLEGAVSKCYDLPDWHVAVVGNFNEGFKVRGPYRSFDEAAERNPGGDVWIMHVEADEVDDDASA